MKSLYYIVPRQKLVLIACERLQYSRTPPRLFSPSTARLEFVINTSDYIKYIHNMDFMVIDDNQEILGRFGYFDVIWARIIEHTDSTSEIRMEYSRVH